MFPIGSYAKFALWWWPSWIFIDKKILPSPKNNSIIHAVIWDNLFFYFSQSERILALTAMWNIKMKWQSCKLLRTTQVIFFKFYSNLTDDLWQIDWNVDPYGSVELKPIMLTTNLAKIYAKDIIFIGIEQDKNWRSYKKNVFFKQY